MRSISQGFRAIASCGYLDNKKRNCPKEAIDAAGAVGIDLSKHRSTVITETIAHEAQVIFIFDPKDYRILINKYPFAKKKIFLLGLFKKNGPINIKDPYGESITDFESIYREIIQSLNTLLSHYSQKFFGS